MTTPIVVPKNEARAAMNALDVLGILQKLMAVLKYFLAV